jgi:hypothetical protein
MNPSRAAGVTVQGVQQTLLVVLTSPSPATTQLCQAVCALHTNIQTRTYT